MLARPFRTLGLALIWLAHAVLGPSMAAPADGEAGDRVVFRHYV